MCNTDGQSPLHTACKNGQLKIVKVLLKDQNCDLNTKNDFGNTPLHLACKNKSIAIIRLLLKMGCSTKILNRQGETAQDIPLNEDGDCLLHIACQWDDIDIVRYLIIDQTCNLNVLNVYLNTPLHLACNKKSLAIIKLLLDERCSTNIRNNKGKTAQDIPLNEDGDCLLHMACQWGDVDIVKYLITDERCHPNIQCSTSRNTPLHIAAKYGQDDTIVQLLSYKECDLNVQNMDGDTPLHVACRRKSLDIIKLLLEQRCRTNITNKKSESAQDIPLNEDGGCLLHIACQWGDVGIVKYLITDERCNPSVHSSFSEITPLHTAAKYGYEDLIVQLLSYKECNPNAQNEEGDTPLHIAVQRSKTAAILQLLAHQQCDLNAQNREGDTPLHIACCRRSLDIIKLLLELRCSTNIPNKKGETAQCIPLNEDGDYLLHIACQWGGMDIVRYLITNEKCDVNVQNNHLNTLLHIACYMKLLTVIRVLLERRCSTNIANEEGKTVQDIPLNEDGDCLLHIACQWGDVDMVKYLISNEKCTTSIPNYSGNTPLHVACYRKSLTILRLFLEMKCYTNTPNKKGVTVQDIQLNEEGDCLLHIACQWGNEDIVRYLITDQRCDLNIQNIYLNTPLHLACNKKSSAIIRLLLRMRCSTNIPNKKGETAQDIPLNEDGDCLLHIACQWGDVDIVKYLLIDTKCITNIQNCSGNTPLHVACYGNLLSIIRLFLERRCSTNFPNKKGETAQDIPLNEDGGYLLHIACQWGDEHIVRYLISDERCDPNIQTSSSGNTPLHTAAEYGQEGAIIPLLSYKNCNPNVQNKEGDTPLHIAVRVGKSPMISQLLANQQLNFNVQNSEGDTPLHIAVRVSKTPVISQLMANKQVNFNVQNNKGDTPLHIITKMGEVEVCELIIPDTRFNMNILNNNHLTPLLTAIKHNNPTVATILLQHRKCDLSLRDLYGNTPLHLACISGETQPEMVRVAKQLLSFVDVDPSCVNNAGQTPLQLTTNYQLIQAVSHFVKCKTKQSVQTYINMFIVGNPETGKSTLVKAICKEATSILWKIVPKRIRRVKNIPLHTAGIIPTTFRSKTFGNTVLYDLAGQVEYYTSHAAVIKSTVISTPPAFIVVVNLCESEEKISQTIRYWWSFIDNHAAQSGAPPHVILAGSHADKIKSTGGSVHKKLTQMCDILKQLPASFYFAGHVALDCRDPASKGIQLFCSLVNESCTMLRETADVDLRCHVLYAFLLDRFQGKVACTVSDVAISVKENRELLPQDSASLIPLISTLSDKGLLLLVECGESHEDWWIILQKQALLGEVIGTIFAPKNFSQHKNLSWNTGVVPYFKLKKEFSDFNPIMVSKFLIHLEFCFKIEDQETLTLLKDEAANVEDTSPDVSQEYYFFPALVSIKNPLHVWEDKLNEYMSCKCGWFYQCIKLNQFLTTQLLHVLILRLAFAFALKLDPGDCCQDAFSLRRKCSVWKHGIAWLNRTPIETVVEVGLQYQSVIVMMRCPKGKESECVQLYSEVIQKILEAKDEHCKAVKMCESFIHPTDVMYPFTDNIEGVKCYSLTEIAKMTVKGDTNVLDRSGLNPTPVQDLLLFDPYTSDTGTKLLRELFSEKHSIDETMRCQVLKTLNSEFENYITHVCTL